MFVEFAVILAAAIMLGMIVYSVVGDHGIPRKVEVFFGFCFVGCVALAIIASAYRLWTVMIAGYDICF